MRVTDMKQNRKQNITDLVKKLEEEQANKLQKLKEIIDMVNLVQPDALIPFWCDLFDHPDLFYIRDLFADSDWLSWYEESLAKDSGYSHYRDYLERASIEKHAKYQVFNKYPKLKNYIFSSFNIKETYKDFCFWFRYLPNLANDAMLYVYKRQEIGENDFPCNHSEHFFLAEEPTTLKIKNNTLLPNAPSLEFLFGLKNIDRLRICLICKRVFWANRKDARGCSPKHNNLIRVRRARKNAQEHQEEWLNSDDRKNHRNKNFSEKDGEK
jgi:hypothetical protein